MTQSPGHQKWPDHKVQEQHLHQRIQVQINGNIIADSADVIEVDEDQHPARFYVPRRDVRMDQLQKSNTVTTCPFKGKARYYNLSVDGHTTSDVAWSYEEPFDEHRALKGMIAFHDEKPEVQLTRTG